MVTSNVDTVYDSHVGNLARFSIASYFRIICLILSGPAALCGFKLCSNLMIPGHLLVFRAYQGIDLGVGPML